MADTTPLSNALNLDLANKLNDMPVAGADNGVTASTSGTVFSASQRNLALANAYNELANRLIQRFGVGGTEYQCEGLIATQTITFSSSGSTINADFILPLRLVKSTGATYKQMTKAELTADDSYYLNNAFTIEGAKLYGYERSAGTLTVLNAGTATLYYVKSDRRSTTTGAPVAVNTAPDTTIDQSWLIWCAEFAAWWLATNKGTGRWNEKAQAFATQVELKLPK